MHKQTDSRYASISYEDVHQSFHKGLTTEHPFIKVGTYEELIPDADLVLNLTPDKQHTAVVKAVMPLMKQGATLAYSHGFNVVEEGMKVSSIALVVKSPRYLSVKTIEIICLDCCIIISRFAMT